MSPCCGEPLGRVEGQGQRVGALGVHEEGGRRHGQCGRSTPSPAASRRGWPRRRCRRAGWPTSAPARPRALAGVHQELDVAGRAGQGGNHRPHDAGSGVPKGGRHPFEGAAATPRDPAPPPCPGPRRPAPPRTGASPGAPVRRRRRPSGPQSTGTTVTREMNDRSAVISEQGSNVGSRSRSISGVNVRTLTRSSTRRPAGRCAGAGPAARGRRRRRRRGPPPAGAGSR